MSDEPKIDLDPKRPDRQGALRMASGLYPNASEQQLMEVLWTHSSYPFGDLDRWTIELVNQKVDAQTVFPTPQ